jgi:pimeloyl-ACP methyl ester carboxylesterase
VDVPTAVVVTTRDRIVPANRQLRLARAIPGASVHQVAAGHGMCLNAPQLFARTLIEACSGIQPGRALAAPCRSGGPG